MPAFSQQQRWLRRGLVLTASLYLVSFYVPDFFFAIGGHSFLVTMLSPFMWPRLLPPQHISWWLVNPLFWVGLGLCWTNYWRIAMLLGGAALVCALAVLFDFEHIGWLGYEFREGYGFWAASVALLPVLATAGALWHTETPRARGSAHLRPLSVRHRILGGALDVVMVLGFFFVAVENGDVVWGILFLVTTGGVGGPVPTLLAWLAFALLALAAFVDHLQGYRALAGGGLALLAGSCVGYVIAAGPHYQLTLLSSIPFLVLFVLRLTHLVLLKPRPEAAARGTAPG